jgi:uncharacterized protein YpmB
MKKKTRTLIILGAVLVLCIGAYVGVSVYNNAQAEKAAGEAKAARLWSADWSAPVSLSYTSGDKTLSFKLDNGAWTIADNKDFPLAQDSVTGIASALTGLTAVRTIDAAAPLSTYGLDKPQYTVTASDDKGDALTLLVGAQNGDNYYAMAKDGGKVYTIAPSLVTSLKPDYLSFIKLDTVPSTSSTNIETITLKTGQTALKLDRHQNKDGTYTWFVVSGDTYTAADEFTLNIESEKSPQKYIDAAVTALSYIKFSSCAAFRPAADALKTYGLDTPQMTVTVDYSNTTGAGTLEQKVEKGTASLEIGAQLADGTDYYARIPGSDQVNVLPASAVEPLGEALTAMGARS